MARSIRVDQLAREINKGLAEYSIYISDETKKAVKEVAKEALKTEKERSPVLTGDYKKGWKNKKEYESDKDIRIVLHNATDYQLVHLLEKGHAKRGGGRVAPVVHVEPVDEMVQEELPKRIERSIRR